MYDIIVVGGGPAGMTAALYGKRNGKEVIVLEKNGFGGQITYSPRVENIPGFVSLSGNEFADKFLEQILSQGVEVDFEEVVSVNDRGNFKSVVTANGNEYLGKTVILATGVKHRMPGLEGEEKFIGDGISFCAVCDGAFYEGKKVCVAGGGNSALQEAILLSEKCAEVIMLQDLDYFTGEQKLQDILFARDNVKKYTGVKILSIVSENDAIKGLEIEKTKTGEKETVYCDGFFVAIGLIPDNDIFKNVCNLDERGYFDVDESLKTNTDGIFTAGDCRKKTVRQVTTACADGAVAALAACEYLR